VLGIFASLTLATTLTSAYGLTIVLFVLTTTAVGLLYPHLPDTIYTRAIVGFFMIAGMSYSASASTLPELVGTVVNMSTLPPAVAYPFVMGLRFIPIPVLIVLFWVVPGNDATGCVPENPVLRKRYLSLGVLFLSVTAVAGVSTSGVYRVWQADVSPRWLLFGGEILVFLMNVVLLVRGYRFSRNLQHRMGRSVLVRGVVLADRGSGRDCRYPVE